MPKPWVGLGIAKPAFAGSAGSLGHIQPVPSRHSALKSYGLIEFNQIAIVTEAIMKIKIRDKSKEFAESLEVVLDEAMIAGRDFAQGVDKLRALKPTDPDYEGRYGELAAIAFLLKLKADAAHQTLDQIIEAEPDDE